MNTKFTYPEPGETKRIFACFRGRASAKLTSYITLCILIAFIVPCLAEETVNSTGFPIVSPESTSENQVNPFGKFIRSAAIPGWGELSMQSGSGYAFLGIEVLLWASRFYCLEEVNLHEQDAYLYALNNAGLKPGNYDEGFLHKLTRYNSSGFGAGGYNEYIFRQAQGLYPDDPELQSQHILDNAILDEDMVWEWGDRDQRRQYSIKRKNADHYRDYVKFVTGVIVANHIISAINSLRIANRINRIDRIQVGVDFTSPQTPFATIQYRF